MGFPRLLVLVKHLKDLIAIIVFIIAVQNVLGEISQPGNIIVQETQNATIRFNATKEIVAAKIGLCGKIEVIDNQRSCKLKAKFLTLDKRGLVFSKDLQTDSAQSYKGRVFFVGNLSLGHAWFVITKLTLNDTFTYGVGIRIKSDSFKNSVVYPVKLIVTKVKTSRNPLFPTPTPHRITSRPHFTEMIISYRPTTSPARFKMFEVVAEKAVQENIRRCGKTKKELLKRAVKRAYIDTTLNGVIIANCSKNKNIVTAKVIITFGEPIGPPEAQSFLKEAEANNKLEGYKITCFAFVAGTSSDQFTPTKKTKEKGEKGQPAWLIAFEVIMALLVVIFIISLILYKCTSLPQRLAGGPQTVDLSGVTYTPDECENSAK